MNDIIKLSGLSLVFLLIAVIVVILGLALWFLLVLLYWIIVPVFVVFILLWVVFLNFVEKSKSESIWKKEL